MKTTHYTNYGRFGGALPTDGQGFVRYSERYLATLRTGGRVPSTMLGRATQALYRAEVRLAAWRREA